MKYPKRQLTWFILFLSVFYTACNSSGNAPRPLRQDSTARDVSITAAEVAGSFSTQSLLKADSTVLDSFFTHYPLLASSGKDLRSFYAARNFALAWYDSTGLIEQAANLLNRMHNLQEEGLSGNIPYLHEADSLAPAGDMRDKSLLTHADFLLTGLYFYFANKVWGGLSESDAKQVNWYLPRKEADYAGWLDSLLQPSASAAEPVYRQYHLLKSALGQYKKLEAENGWPVIVADKKSYRAGDSSHVITEIRKRLYLLGDMPELSDSPVFDTVLEEGVKNFQRRLGTKDDGVIGASTLAALNVPLQKRIEQIIVNIERSRWLPDQVQGDYIAVNIPEFKMHVYQDDSLLWSANVVVGKAANATVVFSGRLQYVVFSPYWNVPASILKNEILPGIAKNKNYLEAHRMEWYNGSVRQKPGPWNSLGLVKFLFPNSYNIYLHDTPSKNLFNEDKRAFSHGCIRVSTPQKLAQHLLRNEPEWTEEKIVQAMHSGKEKYVTLKETVPVFIAYFTAWVDREGKLNFRNDIYNRDGRLAKMLEE